LSAAGSALHVTEAFLRRRAPSPPALEILTVGFIAVIVALLAGTRKTPGYRRALWVTALAVFAVSALHLSNHTGADPWWLELAGHHASLPLALAFLLQVYRFALADIFLKRALALVALVSVVFGAYGVGLAPLLVEGVGAGETAPRTILFLIGMWVATALVYPWIRSASNWFVDNVVLARPDYDMLLSQAAQLASRHDTEAALLDGMARLVGPAFSAGSVSWRAAEVAEGEAALTPNLLEAASRGVTAVIPTVDAPRYLLTVAGLEGGRRLLSDDAAVIERFALIAARRIDALRKAREQYRRDLREREISRLAAEAELRALRAQIEPHFLFNALTTIGYLIQTAPDRALATLFRLSNLLRSLLRSNPEFWPLGDEIRFISDYLDIERARFEDRLAVSIDVPEALRSLRIPTLLLQPLVENAVKHGIGKSTAGGEIRIVARLAETAGPAMLDIAVEDTGVGADEATVAAGRHVGVGLNHVERRLQCYEQGGGRMRFRSRPGIGTAIALQLPAEPADGAPASASVRAAVSSGEAR
jgi:two-component system LytT family sensor kinase